MKTATLLFNDFLKIMETGGSAVGALKVLAEGSASHLPPERLKEIADSLSVALIEAAKNSDTYK